MTTILLGAALVLAALGWSAYAWCVIQGERSRRQREQAGRRIGERRDRAIRMAPPVRARSYDARTGDLERQVEPTAILDSPAWVMEGTMDERFHDDADAPSPDSDWL